MPLGVSVIFRRKRFTGACSRQEEERLASSKRGLKRRQRRQQKLTSAELLLSGCSQGREQTAIGLLDILKAPPLHEAWSAPKCTTASGLSLGVPWLRCSPEVCARLVFCHNFRPLVSWRHCSDLLSYYVRDRSGHGTLRAEARVGSGGVGRQCIVLCAHHLCQQDSYEHHGLRLSIRYASNVDLYILRCTTQPEM